MPQSKLSSLLEAMTNTIIGYLISVAIGQVVYPLLGIAVSLHQNFVVTAIFVAVSLCRSYTFRRFFNWWHQRKLKG